MKKSFFFLLAMMLMYAGFTQKAISDPLAQKREIGSFHSIDVATGIHLILIEGEKEELAVSAATTTFRDKIVTKVEDGMLKIYYENKTKAVNKKTNKQLKAYVSYKALKKLIVATGASTKIEGVLKSSSLGIVASTGATIKGEIDIAQLDVRQSTGSVINLSGKTESMAVKGTTGSKFDGKDIATENCNASVNTGAFVAIRAEKELDAIATTGGKINYKGNATVRQKTTTGGKVSKI